MPDHHDHHAELLAETFQGDWNTGAPAAFARAAARAARRRRGLRALATIAATTGVIVAGVFLTRPRSAMPAAERPAPMASHPSPASRGYEILSDDQLIAQLQDRPLLVVKRADGRRDIVLLEN